MSDNRDTPDVSAAELDAPGRVDVAASRAAADGVGAEKKMCYRNAVMALLTVDDTAIIPDGTRYAEGWVLATLGLPIEHGWLETPDGRVLDPTLVLVDTEEELAGFRYVAARTWDRAAVLEHAITRHQSLPILGGDGWDHMGEAWWQDAYERAQRLFYGPEQWERVKTFMGRSRSQARTSQTGASHE